MCLACLSILAFACEAYAAGTVTACATDVQTGAGLNLTDALAGGGAVKFACKAGTTIAVTRTHAIGGTVDVDGGNAVTLTANSYRAIFLVAGDLTLRQLALRQPYVAFGSARPDPSGIAVGPGALRLNDVQVRGSVNPFSVETITINRSLFENNNTFVLVTAGVAVITNSEFSNNTGAIVLRDNRPPGSGRTTVADISDSRFRDNATAIWWKGRLRVQRSAFDRHKNGGRSGGAIRVLGDAMVEHSSFADNTAKEGGAIWLDGGTLSLRRTTFRRNVAAGDGGAIGVGELTAGSVIARYSSFTENRATLGGAIKLALAGPGVPALQGGPNTFARNTAREGGAIYSALGRVQLERAIFLDNGASVEGGAVYGSRRGTPMALVLANSLAARNHAPDGAAIAGSAISLLNTSVVDNSGGAAIALKPMSHFAKPGANGDLELRNALISRNVGGNCGALPAGQALVHNGHNLQYPAGDCGAAVLTRDPQLSAYYAPSFGSPAYDAGENTLCVAAPISSRDVYGATRPQGASCAVGAVEGDLDPRRTRRVRNDTRSLTFSGFGALSALRALWR
jgi:predicted outer membrane repeat protein